MLLELSHVERTYGGRGGVRDVSLTVPERAIYVLCGANGAGKTTTLSVVAGLLFAARGRLSIDGRAIPLDRQACRPGLGLLTDTPFTDEALTGWQWASFVSGIRNVAWPKDAEETALLLTLQPEALQQRICKLSFGNRRKLVLWIEMMTTRSVLLLDEPLTGLDPSAIEGFHRAARLFVSSGRSIVFSTHLLREAEALATHAGIIHEGVTKCEGSLAEVCAGRSLHETFLKVVAA